MRVLVTGAAGKLGTNLLPAILQDPRYQGWSVRAFCHSRSVDLPGVETINGSLANADDVGRAMRGVTHVLHMAAVKESPALAMDVGVKGMFNLIEAFRAEGASGRFLLIGGDCSVGHIFQRFEVPITEDSPRRAYPGCYALTKVIEEVMLEQSRFQYGLDTCCLRPGWIMEKDDFRFALSFKDQFGGPPWRDLMPADDLADAIAGDCVPLMLDYEGKPLRRTFIHVRDLVCAILLALVHPKAEGQLYNIAMNEPVDYGRVTSIVEHAYRCRPFRISTSFFSNWLSNDKARLQLGWSPKVDLSTMVTEAWSYQRAPTEPRIVWYPG